MYDKLMLESEEDNILVAEAPFGEKIDGLYYMGTIAVNANLDTKAEKCCILAEEMGHHYKTHGNILNLKDICNRKQEKIARNWAYEKLVPLRGLIEAFNQGVHKRYDLADHLGVTEEFLSNAVEHYKERHGTYFELDTYVIYFEPHLAILKMF